MKKILLIDDDQTFANAYRNKLVNEGFEVQIALDGETGFEHLQNNRPDVVLLDLTLPKLSGIEIIKRVRSEPALQEIPIVVFTNTYLTNTIEEAWKAGATKCLAKSSCTPSQVVSTLQSLIAAKSKPEAETSAPEADVTLPSDEEFQGELQRSFVEEFPGTISAIRTQLQSIIKTENDAARLQQLNHLHRRIRSLSGNAGMVGFKQIARLADPLEALLKELFEKPKNINASTLRTVASAVDSLSTLFEQRSNPGKDLTSARILVVDDEAISRRAVTHALDKAKLQSVSVDDSTRAFDMLPLSKFDLIFLDVDMPNMNGYELCTKIRSLPAYKKTPVVFVTSLNDFEARANSTISGGNDFIAKPFLFSELAVKALIYVLRSQLAPVKR
jgi:CheY-like chemotaxis protein